MGARAAPEAGEPRGRPRRSRGDPPLRAPGQGTPGCQAWDSGDVARHVCDTHGNIRDRAGPASPSPWTPVRPRTTPEGGTPTSRPSETTRLPLSVTFFLLDAPTEASRFGAGPRRPSPAWAVGWRYPEPDLGGGTAAPRTRPRGGVPAHTASVPGRVFRSRAGDSGSRTSVDRKGTSRSKRRRPYRGAEGDVPGRRWAAMAPRSRWSLKVAPAESPAPPAPRAPARGPHPALRLSAQLP